MIEELTVIVRSAADPAGGHGVLSWSSALLRGRLGS